jgi:hypothetical protein
MSLLPQRRYVTPDCQNQIGIFFCQGGGFLRSPLGFTLGELVGNGEILSFYVTSFA